MTPKIELLGIQNIKGCTKFKIKISRIISQNMKLLINLKYLKTMSKKLILLKFVNKIIFLYFEN